MSKAKAKYYWVVSSPIRLHVPRIFENEYDAYTFRDNETPKSLVEEAVVVPTSFARKKRNPINISSKQEKSKSPRRSGLPASEVDDGSC